MATATRRRSTRQTTPRTTRAIPRQVTPTGQGQDALTGTDPTQGPEPAPAQTAGEPLKRTGRKNHRSQRADDWANTWLDDPAPCVLCGTPALMRDPNTNKPCHMTCAQTQAAERGQPW